MPETGGVSGHHVGRCRGRGDVGVLFGLYGRRKGAGFKNPSVGCVVGVEGVWRVLCGEEEREILRTCEGGEGMV